MSKSVKSKNKKDRVETRVPSKTHRTPKPQKLTSITYGDKLAGGAR